MSPKAIPTTELAAEPLVEVQLRRSGFVSGRAEAIELPRRVCYGLASRRCVGISWKGETKDDPELPESEVEHLFNRHRLHFNVALASLAGAIVGKGVGLGRKPLGDWAGSRCDVCDPDKEPDTRKPPASSTVRFASWATGGVGEVN
jgi:hypothetical protein